jgi:hypothetical protein
MCLNSFVCRLSKKSKHKGAYNFTKKTRGLSTHVKNLIEEMLSKDSHLTAKKISRILVNEYNIEKHNKPTTPQVNVHNN